MWENISESVLSPEKPLIVFSWADCIGVSMADEDQNQENQELVDNKEDDNKEVDNNETPKDRDPPNKEQQIASQHMRRVNLALPLVFVILAIIGYGLYYNKIDFGRIQVSDQVIDF